MQRVRSAGITLYDLTGAQQSADAQPCLPARKLGKGVHLAARDTERNDGNGPGEHIARGRAVQDSILRRTRCPQDVRVLVGDEDIPDLEVGASRGTNPRYKPRVVDDDIAAIEIAAQRRLVLAVGSFRAREAHEVRCVMGAAAERPPAGNAIAPVPPLGRADRAGGARDETARVGEKFARDRLWQITADAAHASAIADEPPDRPVERAGSFPPGHEITR